jgi:hypothetical protein
MFPLSLRFPLSQMVPQVHQPVVCPHLYPQQIAPHPRAVYHLLIVPHLKAAFHQKGIQSCHRMGIQSCRRMGIQMALASLRSTILHRAALRLTSASRRRGIQIFPVTHRSTVPHPRAVLVKLRYQHQVPHRKGAQIHRRTGTQNTRRTDIVMYPAFPLLGIRMYPVSLRIPRHTLRVRYPVICPATGVPLILNNRWFPFCQIYPPRLHSAHSHLNHPNHHPIRLIRISVRRLRKDRRAVLEIRQILHPLRRRKCPPRTMRTLLFQAVVAGVALAQGRMCRRGSHALSPAPARDR